MPQPNNPYAPPSTLPDADVKLPASRADRAVALRRGWRAFGLWLVGLSVANALTACFVELPLGWALSWNPARIGIVSACFATATFLHHLRVARAKPPPIFIALTPVAGLLAFAITTLTGDVVKAFDSLGPRPNALSVLAPGVMLAVAVAMSLFYAITLGLPAFFVLPALTHRVNHLVVRFVLLGIVLAAVLMGMEPPMRSLFSATSHYLFPH
jgi:hypothetical protein